MVNDVWPPGGATRGPRVVLTNADKVLYPSTGTTKADVFSYYTTIADVMLPHIAGRPVTRKRWPNGVGEPAFFEKKQLASSAPGGWLERATVDHRSGSTTYPIIETPPTGLRGLRSRRRWKSMCRSGGSPRTERSARQHVWCSTSTRAKA